MTQLPESLSYCLTDPHRLVGRNSSEHQNKCRDLHTQPEECPCCPILCLTRLLLGINVQVPARGQPGHFQATSSGSSSAPESSEKPQLTGPRGPPRPNSRPSKKHHCQEAIGMVCAIVVGLNQQYACRCAIDLGSGNSDSEEWVLHS